MAEVVEIREVLCYFMVYTPKKRPEMGSNGTGVLGQGWDKDVFDLQTPKNTKNTHQTGSKQVGMDSKHIFGPELWPWRAQDVEILGFFGFFFENWSKSPILPKWPKWPIFTIFPILT